MGGMSYEDKFFCPSVSKAEARAKPLASLPSRLGATAPRRERRARAGPSVVRNSRERDSSAAAS